MLDASTRGCGPQARGRVVGRGRRRDAPRKREKTWRHQAGSGRLGGLSRRVDGCALESGPSTPERTSPCDGAGMVLGWLLEVVAHRARDPTAPHRESYNNESRRASRAQATSERTTSMNSTGHPCPQSGIWRGDCACRTELALSKGDIFPPCRACRRAINYILVGPTY